MTRLFDYLMTICYDYLTIWWLFDMTILFDYLIWLFHLSNKEFRDSSHSPAADYLKYEGPDHMNYLFIFVILLFLWLFFSDVSDMSISGHHFGPVPRGPAPTAGLLRSTGGRGGKLSTLEPASHGLLHQENPADLRDDDRETRLHVGRRTLWGEDQCLPRPGSCSPRRQ